MEFMKSVIEWLSGPNGAILFAVLFGVSEALAAIPAVKANSVFQWIVNLIKWMKEKFQPAK